MKIGITAEMLINPHFTGIEHYINNLARELLKYKEHNIRLILPSDIPFEYFPASSVFNYEPPFIKLGRFVSSLINYPRSLREFDVVHVPTVTAPFFIRPPGVKVVMTVHDLLPNIFPAWQPLKRRIYFKYILKHRFLHVDRFIAVSENTKNDLVRIFNIDQDKIDVVYDGVSERFKPPVMVKRKNYILSVSTLEPRKNFKRLIDAYISLKEQHGITDKLCIIGKKGWFFDEIIDVPEKHRNDIVFKGYVSNKVLVEMYQKAKLFIYPSMYEGFGLPIIEAMACGCPVITSNVSSLPEVGGEAAFFVNPTKINELSKKIYTVLSDSALRTKMSRKGIKQAKKFTWQKCAGNTIDVYEKVAGNK